MDLDESVVRAAYGAAGELQAEMHELRPELVSEADLKRAVRRGLQMQLGPFVLPEDARGFKLDDWPGRLGSPDVVVRPPDATGQRAFTELKWCRENKMQEVLWDLLKLSLAARLHRIEACYLIVGAPAHAWPDDRWACAALLADGEWSTRDLLQWLGDSLDGTLARVRQIQRPRYGYYLDHLVDAIATAAIGIGLGLSPYMLLSVGTLLVVAYLVLSINVYLESQALGHFSIGYGRIGPTEARILLIALNSTLALGLMPSFSVLATELTALDVVGVAGAAAMAALLVHRARRNLRTLATAEPAAGRGH